LPLEFIDRANGNSKRTQSFRESIHLRVKGSDDAEIAGCQLALGSEFVDPHRTLRKQAIDDHCDGFDFFI
jgi:hypothetical protein